MNVKKIQKDKKYIIDKEKIANNEKLNQLSIGLPIHTEYRLKNLYKILKNIVYQDVSYHIQAIENLSPVLSLLQKFEQNMEQEELNEQSGQNELQNQNQVHIDPVGI